MDRGRVFSGVRRAVMGLGAGIVFPLSLAVVSATFGDAERPKAIGILTAAVAGGGEAGADAAAARASIAQAAQLASGLPAGGPALRAAAGSAFLHGMSIVMLTCAAVTFLAGLASFRYLPGRAAPGPARQPPATASPPASTRR